MNPTLRKIIVAGLGSLAVTEKAVRRLIDDLVSKGDITRGEGERMLAELQQKWESGHFGEKWEKGRKDLEKTITSAVSTALDRVGLARKSEIEALKRKIEKREAGKKRSAATSARGGVK